jgi:hypothetical protein
MSQLLLVLQVGSMQRLLCMLWHALHYHLELQQHHSSSSSRRIC